MPKTPIDKLQAAVNKALEEYAKDSNKTIEDLSKEFTKKGVQAVKGGSKSAFGGTGEYAAGWTSRFETGRLSAQGTIYNRISGLPHLLEKGHAKRNGGRVAGREHIAPVEQEICEAFEKAVKNDLQRSR